MTTAAETIEASMPELRTWIGRRQVVEDEIGLTTVRRIAAMLDLDPGCSSQERSCRRTGSAMFFYKNALQGDIGPDGHPEKGVFLPPIPLPRRMGAGRRVRSWASSRANDAGEARRGGGRHRAEESREPAPSSC